MHPSSPYMTATARVINVISTVYSHRCNIDIISKQPEMKSLSTRSTIFNHSQQDQITSKSKDVCAMFLPNLQMRCFSSDNNDSSLTDQSEASEALPRRSATGLSN